MSLGSKSIRELCLLCSCLASNAGLVGLDCYLYLNGVCLTRVHRHK